MCVYVCVKEVLTMIIDRKAKPMRALSTWMSSMELGRLVSTVVLKPGINPLIVAPDRGRGWFSHYKRGDGKPEGLTHDTVSLLFRTE